MIVLYVVIAVVLGALFSFLIMKNSLKMNDDILSLNKKLEEELSVEKESHNSLKIDNAGAAKEISLLKEQIVSLKTDLNSLDNLYENLLQTNSTLTANNEALKSKQSEIESELEERRQRQEKEFRLMANSILEENSKKYSQINQSEIKNILDPLSQNLEGFRKKIDEVYDKESKERFSLHEKIKDLVELNNKISDDAKNLTRALKGDNKVQGDWGEMILESILERSGLQKDREYFIQETLKDEFGNVQVNHNGKKMRPDVTIVYPDQRKVIVDSKVSISAYIRLIEAVSKEDADKALKAHLLSVKNHIDELWNKNYQNYAKSLDFVMLFIPNEGAYLAAIQGDDSLWQYAYDKRVMLISPYNLITS